MGTGVGGGGDEEVGVGGVETRVGIGYDQKTLCEIPKE